VFGAVTVTMPVYAVADAVSDAVFSANISGTHEVAAVVVVQGPAAPTLGVSHVADELTESESALAFPLVLYASTVWLIPLAPGTIETGPTVALTRRSMGEDPD
jgi:hypothetical protein